MITVDEIPRLRTNGRFGFSFYGLSTDEKPVKTFPYNGTEKEIANGSTFVELDTMAVYMYDEENDAWKG